ncbi:DUF938-like protein [Fragilaria crotonensis]|nr:DUF938-like protein [Fragilaria crotonensis]
MSARLDSPSAQRNKEVIWNVLKSRIFHPEGESHVSQLRVLEIAAGSGVHSRYFCEQLLSLLEDRGSSDSSQTFPKSVIWFPTDPTVESRRSIEAYRDDTVSGILQLPFALTLDETGIVQDDLPIDDGSIDVIVCINMIHISPWEATVGLLKAAQRLLKPGSGILYCYGPFREGGTAVESNLAFEVWLHSLDSSYGLRNLEDVVDLAESSNLLEFMERVEMPANNLSVLFRRKHNPTTINLKEIGDS